MRGEGFRGSSLPRAILQIVGISGVVLAALVAPNAVRLFRGWGRDWNEIGRQEQHRIRAALERLRQRRLVKFVTRGDDTFIQVTEKGKSYLRQFRFSQLHLPKLDRWDKTWRLITFDIPEYEKQRRDILSDKLKKLGCLSLQKSVLAYPFPCRDEIDFIISFLGISRHVLYIETGSLGSAEGLARKYFRLL